MSSASAPRLLGCPAAARAGDAAGRLSRQAMSLTAIEYIAVVTAGNDGGPHLLRRFPTRPRAATPFPPLLTAFALPDASQPTANPPAGGVTASALTLQDSTRIHMVSLHYYERSAGSDGLWVPVAPCALLWHPSTEQRYRARRRTREDGGGDA